MAALLCLACASRPHSQQQTAVTDRRTPEIQLSSFIGQIRGSQWSPDGRRIVVWSLNAAVVFDSNTGESVFRTHAPSSKFFEAAGFSPGSHWLMLSNSGAEYPIVQLEQYDLTTLDVPRRWPAATTDSSWLFTSDGSQIVWLEPTAANSNAKFALNVADTATHQARLRIELPAVNNGVREIVLSPDSHLVAVSGEEKISFVLLENAKLFEFDQTPEGSAIAFDPPGGRVAWLVLGGVAIWDGKSDAPRILRDTRCLRPEPNIPNSNPGIFSPTENLLAMPANDNRVCVWDLTAWRVRAILPEMRATSEAGPAMGTPVAWSRAGRSLIMFDGNGMYYDWDLTKHTPVITKIEAFSMVAGASFILTTPVETEFEQHALIVRSNGKNKHVVPITDCFLGQSDGFDDLVYGADDWAVVRCSPRPAIVHLSNDSVRRPLLEHWEVLRFNVPSKLLALESRFGLSLFDVEHDSVRARLLTGDGEDLDDSADANQSPYLELTPGSVLLESRSFWKSRRSHVDYLRQRLTLRVEEFEAQVCSGSKGGPLHHVGSRFAWTPSTPSAPGILCDSLNGEELGRLKLLGNVMAINRTGTAAVVADLAGIQLWRPGRSALVPLPSKHWWGLDDTTLVGLDSDGSVVVYDTESAQQRYYWNRIRADVNTAADAVAVNAHLGLMFGGPKSHDLLRIEDGGFVGALPQGEQFDAVAIGSNGVVATSFGGHVTFWSIPSFDRLGELMIDGNEAVFIAKSGEFETAGDPERWRSRLSCVAGATKLPYERCLAELYRHGIVGNVLGL